MLMLHEVTDFAMVVSSHIVLTVNLQDYRES